MTSNHALEALERDAYRASYSDGIVDVFVGLSLVWIGAAWIWLPDFAGLAGVLPAVFVTPLLAARKRFVESRVGYVKWSDNRRHWEHRNLLAGLLAGVLLLAGGIATFFAVSGPGGFDFMDAVGPGLLAFLLALMAIGLAFMMDAPRMFAYAAALVVAGAIAAWADANPGWPLLATGGFVTAVGAAMLLKMLRTSPAVEGQ